MSCRRFLYRRKFILRTITLFVIYFLVKLLFAASELASQEFVNVFEIEEHVQKSDDHEQCVLPNTTTGAHADLYTFDLPDVTNYEFVRGKRFKEYQIPVKNESVAYEANLIPVEVMLIPFSHVDPGYGMTLEQYYARKTKNTLNNMVKKLKQYPDLTFQWAETVFLERWWRDISESVKRDTRALIREGRLEILSGGWVMPDEAITHYSPVIDQLIEGHQWLWENLGVKPKNNWANDPFGYSSAFPYFWKKSGMKNMVILRIHQAIKGKIMEHKALEFMWKPLWSTNSSNDMLCHLMPYRGYWIGDTCGPYNQHICREYAFMHTNPVDKVVYVTKDNIAERARILYEQYRITADVYKRDNVDKLPEDLKQLYVPIFLGEDFSYVTESDYDLIYTQYRMLFDYINSKSEWKMKLKFGTIDEYFTKIRANQDKVSKQDGSRFPSISGDFLPYSDYQNDYWTGYYTTRPFIKQLSRELQSTLKLADIFHSYAHAQSRAIKSDYSLYNKVTALLRDARRNLGMFLHHDGITGTSVIPVIQDFHVRIAKALVNTKTAIKHIAGQILTQGQLKGNDVYSQTTIRDNINSLPDDKVFNLTTTFMAAGSLVSVINPTPRWRTDVVSVVVKSKDKYIFISSSSEKNVTFQADDVDPGVSKRLTFQVELPPFGIKSYRIEAFRTKMIKHDFEEDTLQSASVQKQNANTRVPLQLENDHMEIKFNKQTGLPSRMYLKDGSDTGVNINTDILAYTSLRSGAYIFAPKGTAEKFLSGTPEIKVNNGPLVSEIKAIYRGLEFSTKLYHVNGIKGKGVHVSVKFDLSVDSKLTRDKELILRFKTDIDNKNKFFTDQNGFQLMGRKNREHRSIEENYYPITTLLALEDSSRRLALHVGQPHGAASLKPGWMEVMLDRRVTKDDNKGLGQGVMDNILTVANFVLQLEKQAEDNDFDPDTAEVRYTYPSESNDFMNEMLNEPTFLLFAEEFSPFRGVGFSLQNLEFAPIEQSVPCDTSLVGLRVLSKDDLAYNGTSLVLHRKPRHCGYDVIPECRNSQKVNLKSLFSGVDIQYAEETSLTHLYVVKNISDTADLRPDPMELKSYLLHV